MMENNTYDLVIYDVNEAVIKKIADAYLPLKVTGVDDKANYEIVRKARLDVVKHRTAIEKERKKYKEKALKYGRDVDAEAKRLTALLEPVEDHLTEQENIVLHEIERKKREAEEKEAARIQARIDNLFSIGCTFNGQNYLLPFAPAGYTVPSPLAKTCNDEQFEVICGEFQKLVDAENKRIADEKAAKIAEEERLANIKEEQEAESKRLAAIAEKQAEKERKIKEAEEKIEKEKQRLIDEENKRVAAAAREQQRIEDEKKRVEELEKAKKEAAEKAIKEAEEKAKRDAEEQAEKERIAKIAAEKKAARLPDKEKLLAWIATFNETNNPSPALKTQEAKAIYQQAMAELELTLQEAEKRTGDL
ncbi:MAG: hypothetical protein PHP01_07760 [Phycisphaerae bacterium]|nr:hypothetical protein [Phycisphaerae bacterium]